MPEACFQHDPEAGASGEAIRNPQQTMPLRQIPALRDHAPARPLRPGWRV